MIDLSNIDVNGDLAVASGKDLFAERQKAREDLSYIDQASAILSRGGGKAFSIKSSSLRSITDVMTAPTNPSVSSSIIRSSHKSGLSLRLTYST